MFKEACQKIRESLYGIMGGSIIKRSEPDQTANFTNGTGFMVSPGYIVTAAHLIHVDNDPTKPVHQNFEVIRAPDIGQPTEKANFIAEDSARDIAVLKIEGAKNTTTVNLATDLMFRGENCGFLSFPLANIVFQQNGTRQFNLFERFQGAYISNYMEAIDPMGRKLPFYEIDTLMYSGSSGCPGFTIEAKIIGMQVRSVMQKNKDDDKSERVAISHLIPSTDILNFLKAQKINIV